MGSAFGERDARTALEADDVDSPTDLLADPRAGSLEEILSALAEGGVTAERSAWAPLALTVTGGNAAAHSLVSSGALAVVDVAAQALAALVLAAALAVDVAAAPGGKTRALLASGRARRVVALERTASRAARLAANLAAAGRRGEVLVVRADAGNPPLSPGGSTRPPRRALFRAPERCARTRRSASPPRPATSPLRGRPDAAPSRGGALSPFPAAALLRHVRPERENENVDAVLGAPEFLERPAVEASAPSRSGGRDRPRPASSRSDARRIQRPPREARVVDKGDGGPPDSPRFSLPAEHRRIPMAGKVTSWKPSPTTPVCTSGRHGGVRLVVNAITGMLKGERVALPGLGTFHGRAQGRTGVNRDEGGDPHRRPGGALPSRQRPQELLNRKR